VPLLFTYLQQALPHLQTPALHAHLSSLHLQFVATHFILHVQPGPLHFEHLLETMIDPFVKIIKKYVIQTTISVVSRLDTFLQ